MSSTIDGIIYSDDKKTVEGVADKGIKTAALPDGVEHVVMKAFADCAALEEVSIPNSMVDIKKSSFKNCISLLTVRLGDDVKNLSPSWFASLPKQYEIDCDPGSMTFKIVRRSTALKLHVKELALDDAKSEKKKQVQSAGVDAILSISLAARQNSEFKIISRRRTATNALIRIGRNCGIFRFGTDSARWMPKVPKIIEILGDQEKDGAEIFAEIRANKLTLCDVSSPGDVLINSDADGNLNLFTSGNLKDCKINGDGNLSIFGAESVGRMRGMDFETLTVGGGLDFVWDRAFARCKRLKSATFSEGLLSICNGAFEDCESLSSVRLPESLRTIGDGAFEGCAALSSIQIPKATSRMGKDVFRDTNIRNLGYSLRLQRVDHSSNKPVEYDFTIKDSLAIENGGTVAYCAAKSEGYRIPHGVTKIAGHAFYCCRHAKHVFIPETVREIGECAFYGCSSLKKIDFGGTAGQWKAIKKGRYWQADTEMSVITIGDYEKKNPPAWEN